jgi:hypothetical protein
MEEIGLKRIHSLTKRCSLGRRWALGRDGDKDRMWAGEKTFHRNKVGPGRGWGWGYDLGWGKDVSLRMEEEMGLGRRCSLGKMWALGIDGVGERMWAEEDVP